MNGKKQFPHKLTVRVTEAQYAYVRKGLGSDSLSVRAIINRDRLGLANYKVALEESFPEFKAADPNLDGWTTPQKAIVLLIVGIFLGIVIACALIKTGVL